VKPLRDFVRSTPFFVCAHRGASGDAPENTLAALQLAIDGGAMMVELDVQLTRDRQCIVFHDDILGRTTNGSGHVRNFDAEHLRQLDAGSWFNASFANERIPYFRDALRLLKDKAYLNIEIKPLQESPTALDDLREILAVIQQENLQPYVIFSSFDHRTIAEAKRLDPMVRTVAINVPGDKRPPSEVVAACNADGYGCSINELNAARMEDAHGHHIPVGVYTVNTEEHLRKALKHRVNAVVSNHPAAMSALAATILGERHA
jgi:glycerophosphoryl diester phosphodiesterase